MGPAASDPNDYTDAGVRDLPALQTLTCFAPTFSKRPMANKNWLRLYWSRERLSSVEARRDWLRRTLRLRPSRARAN